MTHTITAQDGTDDTTVPIALDQYAPSSESGNTIHRLLDGDIAATLVGDLPANGSMRLWYESDADAASAGALLGRATSFALSSDSRAAVNMTFVREGPMSPVMHDRILGLWNITVGFQEIT